MERIELRQDATFRVDANDISLLNEALGSIINGNKFRGDMERLQDLNGELSNTLSEMGLYC